jgi:hypothetical protein
MHKTTEPVVTVKAIRPPDGEQELDNRAPTQLSRAGIVANVLLPTFETESAIKINDVELKIILLIFFLS